MPCNNDLTIYISVNKYKLQTKVRNEIQIWYRVVLTPILGTNFSIQTKKY